MWILHRPVEPGQIHFQGTTQYKTIFIKEDNLHFQDWGIVLMANMD